MKNNSKKFSENKKRIYAKFDSENLMFVNIFKNSLRAQWTFKLLFHEFMLFINP